MLERLVKEHIARKKKATSPALKPGTAGDDLAARREGKVDVMMAVDETREELPGVWEREIAVGGPAKPLLMQWHLLPPRTPGHLKLGVTNLASKLHKGLKVPLLRTL